MIKPLSASDAVSLTTLHERAMDKGWSEADFTAHLKAASDDVLGLYDEGELCGFVIARTLFDQAEILTLAVDATRRKRGFGQALMTAAEHAITLRGGEIIFLDVADDNTAAIALYRTIGFVHYASRPGYYRRTEGDITTRVTAHLMQKRLTG